MAACFEPRHRRRGSAQDYPGRAEQVRGFNKFAQWAYFGADTIAENVRDDQVKVIKYNHLIANLVIFHNCHTITQA